MTSETLIIKINSVLRNVVKTTIPLIDWID